VDAVLVIGGAGPLIAAVETGSGFVLGLSVPDPGWLALGGGPGRSRGGVMGRASNPLGRPPWHAGTARRPSPRARRPQV